MTHSWSPHNQASHGGGQVRSTHCGGAQSTREQSRGGGPLPGPSLDCWLKMPCLGHLGPPSQNTTPHGPATSTTVISHISGGWKSAQGASLARLWGESSLPDLQTTAFSLCLHVEGRERDAVSSSSSQVTSPMGPEPHPYDIV